MSPVELGEKCGIAGVITQPGENAANVVVVVAKQLQHRGQEGGGVGVKRLQGDFQLYREGRRFGQIFSSPEILSNNGLNGEIALGHTRYRTRGPANLTCYAQPMRIHEQQGSLLGAHNGNIANAEELLGELRSKGIRLDTENQVDDLNNLLPISDSEILFRRIASSPGMDWTEKIARGLSGVEGSFSLLLATDRDEMIALRDPWGVRPLSFGRLNGYFVVASETHVLDMIGAVDQTEVGKGEMWVFRSKKDPERVIYDDSKPWKRCDFEDWYFAWPSSRRNGIEASAIREACGYQLAKEELSLGRLVNADMVVCAPDTARSGATFFAEGTDTPYRERIYKSRYDGEGNRSFIGSSEAMRRLLIDKKYHYDSQLAGQVIYLTDDTGVRLLTTGIMDRALKERAGVKEVHVRLLAPKFIRPCFLGTNINVRDELGVMELRDGVWVVKSDEQIAREIGADSVAFLSMDGRRRVRERFGERAEDFCGYCHGDCGPDFNFSRYDPALALERSLVVQR